MAERDEDQKPEERLKLLIKQVVREMVDDAEAVDVSMSRGEQTIVYSLFVAPDDRGKMIGKGGQNITALRQLLRTWLAKYKFRAVIDLLDS